MNVHIVGGGYDYITLFKSLGHQIVDDFLNTDLFVFTGGADVSPYLYGDKAHKYTGNSPERDAKEQKVFEWALNHQTPMVGICRGGQFLNVMSGGRMYQHVEEHTRSHSMVDLQTGETVYVSSTHHQMMMPSPDALLVATASLGGEREWFDGVAPRKDVSTQDIEVVYYKHTNCLCFQPHPEFQSAEYEGMKQYFKGLLDRFLEVV